MAATEESIRVTHEVGDRFSIVVRGHEVRVDQPVDAGGDDLAPTPTELFVMSLASCVAFYGRRFLRRHSLPEEISVVASWKMADRPARVSEIEIVVSAAWLPEARLEAFRRVCEHCTVHNSIADPPRVTIAARSGRTAEDVDRPISSVSS